MITITPYNAAWPAMFEAEAASLRAVLGERALRIEHVGSTAVPGLAAKPVIDIQVSVESLEPRHRHIELLGHLGYVHVPLGTFDRVYPFFQKPPQGPSTHHVHLCVSGSRQEREHLAFRDHLRRHPELAVEYLALKRALAADNHGNTLESRERYSLAKSEFVQSVLQRALYGDPRP
jgi:GrpB-like predicted nucleotidyltransferase (UPF0157 family)